MNVQNPNERLMRFLAATPAQQTAIDQFLQNQSDLIVQQPVRGPLLLTMGIAARYLGVSRATLWRMVLAGRIEKVEVLPNSYRIRRADIEELVKKRSTTQESQR